MESTGRGIAITFIGIIPGALLADVLSKYKAILSRIAA